MTSDLRDTFDRLTRDEPPTTLEVGPIIERGRRSRRRRTALTTATALTGTTVLAAAVAVPLALHSGTRTVTVRPLAALSAPQAGAKVAPALSAYRQQVAATIEAASPAGWTFTFRPGGADQDLEGTVDDGQGAARLMVGVTPEAGYQQVHPCTDPEFKAGVTCTERTLADGSVLSLRALTTWEDQRWFEAVVTRPDGSGFSLENGNFTIPDIAPGTVLTSAAEKRKVTANTVTRPQPAYTLDGLAKVLVALDAMPRG